MTRSGPLRRWDPFRPLDMLATLWSSAAVAPLSTGAAAAYRTLFMTLRRLDMGRPLTLSPHGADHAPLGPPGWPAGLEGSPRWLKPRAVGLRRKRWALLRRTPAYPVRLP